MTLADLCRCGADSLCAALALDPRAARLEAQILLGSSLGGRSRAWLIAHDRDSLTLPQAAAFQELLERRLAGEPVAYILGEREFYGMTFKVTPDVLIPRPETELLVELALSRLPQGSTMRVLDLGTGSGAVALSIAAQRPQATVTAVDISPAALDVARENARRLAIPNVRFLQGAWFAALPEQDRYGLIVSNPPYVATGDPHLSQGDVRFEPSGALASGVDGLDDIRTIVAGAPAHLAPGGWLLFEHGYDQAAACRALLEQAGYSNVASSADLAGIERVTLGQSRTD